MSSVEQTSNSDVQPVNSLQNDQSAISTPAADATTKTDEPRVDFRVYRPPRSSGGAPGSFHRITVLLTALWTSILVDLPDSYFQPSAADLKAAQASLAARTQALANAPLRTQAMRDAEDKVKRAKWPTVRVYQFE